MKCVNQLKLIVDCWLSLPDCERFLDLTARYAANMTYYGDFNTTYVAAAALLCVTSKRHVQIRTAIWVSY